MKILSVNISEPKKILFNGKTLVTSIYKQPVNECLELNKLGLQGDKQADLNSHGGRHKALYIYSYIHYKYWGNILNKDFSKDYGLVGENFTVDDFDENNYFIGDEFEISNVIIKITQPRIPCYKLGIKMNNKNFLKKFVEYGHLGMYAKVKKTGQVKSGDTLKLIRRENETMSVYDISRLIFDKNDNIDSLKKAMRIKSLSEEIKTEFNKRLVKLGHFENI